MWDCLLTVSTFLTLNLFCFRQYHVISDLAFCLPDLIEAVLLFNADVNIMPYHIV